MDTPMARAICVCVNKPGVSALARADTVSAAMSIACSARCCSIARRSSIVHRKVFSPARAAP
jgi:hypothetical protein